MGKLPTSSSPPLLLLLLSLLLLPSSPSPASATITGPEGMMTMTQIDFMLKNNNNQCKGSVGECLDSNEFEMDLGSNRRILATASYISYGALQANRVPCSQRGASYYNCLPGATANPYTRGCSSIARCRR